MKIENYKLKILSVDGFTLIETLIYITLFAIIIGGGMVGAYRLLESSDHTNAKTIVEQEANFVIRKIDNAMTGATSVSVPDATHLNITKSGTLAFALNGTVLELDGTPLTSANISIKNLTFTKIVKSGKPDAIKTTFTVASPYNQDEIFTNTKYLR